MANCISFIGNGPSLDHMSSWSLASDMSDVLETKTLQNVCLVGNELKADEICCPDLQCVDVCAVILHECGEDVDRIIRIQSPVLGAYDSDEGLCLCIEDFCVTDSTSTECCNQDDLLDMCSMMGDPCLRLDWLTNIYYQRIAGKTIVSASTPAGRSVTFAQVSIQCLKDEINKAKTECELCNPCGQSSRCWSFRNC